MIDPDYNVIRALWWSAWRARSPRPSYRVRLIVIMALTAAGWGVVCAVVGAVLRACGMGG